MYKLLLSLLYLLKQLYINNKTERPSHKGGRGVCGHHNLCVSKYLKEELPRLQVNGFRLLVI